MCSTLRLATDSSAAPGQPTKYLQKFFLMIWARETCWRSGWLATGEW